MRERVVPCVRDESWQGSWCNSPNPATVTWRQTGLWRYTIRSPATAAVRYRRRFVDVRLMPGARRARIWELQFTGTTVPLMNDNDWHWPNPTQTVSSRMIKNGGTAGYRMILYWGSRFCSLTVWISKATIPSRQFWGIEEHAACPSELVA